MPLKEETLDQIKQLAYQGVLEKDEMLAAYNAGDAARESKSIHLEKAAGGNTEKTKFAVILYYIGAVVVVFGIAIFLGQRWFLLTSMSKIAVTLGSSIVAYYAGLFLSRNEKTTLLGSAFFLISALTMPIGLYVVFDQAGYNMQNSGLRSLLLTILVTIYLSSFFIFKKSLFILFTVIFATGLFFSLNDFLIGGHPFFASISFEMYLTFIVGFSYLLLGSYFSQTQYSQLLWFFYGVGIIYFLGSAFSLGGWKPEQNLFWELLFPFLVLGTLFFSVRLRSKALLSFGALFLVIYLFKITDEYFTDTIGWPLSLVIAGLSMIAVGYLFFVLKKEVR